ncbi:MAG: hypothetical protein M1830_005676 [Pleopsidium flavum]|nr:MAG: hypothetical protein M1830_005676 [Pleopsidium flavum]
MCYRKKAIFTTCGHSLWGRRVGTLCSANTTPSPSQSQPPWQRQPCKNRSHPFQTLRIDTLCPHCSAERARLLEALESEQEERVSGGAWGWKALVPKGAGVVSLPRETDGSSPQATDRLHMYGQYLSTTLAIAPPPPVQFPTLTLTLTLTLPSFSPLTNPTRQTPKMPTPESALFLSKKPAVPPTFDGVDYDDTPRLKQAQDAVIREQWVRSMMARLVREELGKCYYREGVNHLEKCGALRGMFLWERFGGMGNYERDLGF